MLRNGAVLLVALAGINCSLLFSDESDANAADAAVADTAVVDAAPSLDAPAVSFDDFQVERSVSQDSGTGTYNLSSLSGASFVLVFSRTDETTPFPGDTIATFRGNNLPGIVQSRSDTDPGGRIEVFDLGTETGGVMTVTLEPPNMARIVVVSVTRPGLTVMGSKDGGMVECPKSSEIDLDAAGGVVLGAVTRVDSTSTLDVGVGTTKVDSSPGPFLETLVAVRAGAGGVGYSCAGIGVVSQVAIRLQSSS